MKILRYDPYHPYVGKVIRDVQVRHDVGRVRLWFGDDSWWELGLLVQNPDSAQDASKPPAAEHNDG